MKVERRGVSPEEALTVNHREVIGRPASVAWRAAADMTVLHLDAFDPSSSDSYHSRHTSLFGLLPQSPRGVLSEYSWVTSTEGEKKRAEISTLKVCSNQL